MSEGVKAAALLLILAGVAPATAEDRNPPPWRGQPLSTFQHWEFSVPPPDYPRTSGPDSDLQPPTQARNPYSAGVDDLFVCARGLMPPKMEWLDRFAGMQGVWRLELVKWGGAWIWGFLEFGIKNADKAHHVKEMRVQVTSNEVAGPPELFLLERLPPPRYWAEVPIAQDGNAVALGGGATHRTYVARFPDCPSDELLSVHSPKGGVVYVDQVVVDTICRPVEQQQQQQPPTPPPSKH